MRTSTAHGSRLTPIPTRAVVAIAGTALGLILLFSFKTPDQAPHRLAGAAAPAASAGPIAASGPGATSAPGAAAAPTAAPKATTVTGTKTVIGDDVPNQFGDVQVQVTFSGRKITDVKALQLPSDRARSAQISNFAAPYLRTEALQAQSAQIDLISGATYTSESYAQSLQSAIDKAGV
ncbi:MAG TPA: FMN-binding protein [Candidatus Limnocylindrales bacterium]